MAFPDQSALYERLFLLNRCLEQAAEIVEQFHNEGLLHSEYAARRKHTLEDLRADLGRKSPKSNERSFLLAIDSRPAKPSTLR
jgi:hypothetical protein